MSLPLLLIDDNPDACAMAAKLLWASGYQTDVAYDGASALQLVDKKPYTLAIIDYQLPDTNGCELFHRMRQRQPHLLGILLTGYECAEVDEAAAKAGMSQVLAKPVNYIEFIPLLEEIVGKCCY